MEATISSRSIKELTLVNDFAKESLDLMASHSISCHRISRVLAAIVGE
jgi:hypothetical protein